MWIYGHHFALNATFILGLISGGLLVAGLWYITRKVGLR